ncbi:MAG: hypothetical protein A2284_15675 [Deltaproteobacteria bacterium RIFOXYA12_FULL_61_11]|nr:MAG: hypothetical protein A2284_15675 [Deltaproteobacteria bacterium RIFOXYA12_FULL_61_11]
MQRKNYLINKSFQLRYLGYVLSLLATLFLVYVMVMATLIGRMREANEKLLELGTFNERLLGSAEMRQEPTEEISGKFKELRLLVQRNTETIQAINLFSALFMLFLAFAVVMVGLVVTHRIAGPLHVLRLMLEKLRDGEELPARSLRHHDEFQDLFELVRQLARKKH